MKTPLLALAAILALAVGPVSQAADPAAGVARVWQSGGSPGPKFGPWGFDLAGRDEAVTPGADFYDYANGHYLKELVIPPDRARWGMFDALSALSEERVRDILEKASADPTATGDQGKIGAFYRAYMDEARAEALGARPLAPRLSRIRAVQTKAQLAGLMGEAAKSFYGAFFTTATEVDAKDPAHYAVYLGQGGLSLPDRDYYVEPAFAAQKAKYQAYVAQMLGLGGWANPEAEAAAIVGMETKIAEASWTRADQRDPTKIYNPMSPAKLAAAAPGFDWKAYLKAADLGRAPRLVVEENSAFPKIAAIFAATPLETLKAWEAFTVIDAAAPLLSEPFVDAHFAFRSKTLSGQEAQKPRWKRAVETINADVGEAVGRAYVAAYFPPEAKAKMLDLVQNVRAALAERIRRVTWMSDATKARALQKLSMLGVKIGYPAKWRDYSRLAIAPDDLVGDVERSTAFEWDRQVRRLRGPVDRGEWDMTPQTVNAYYDPTKNEIVFPAAILQPPFFDAAADPAVNYGGIGGVIGHEMTHGFDDEGRHFDGSGRLTEWWTAADSAKFVAQTKRLGAQYSAFEPLPGAHIKGDQTMGENIADLGGLLLALDAYHSSLGGRPAPALDGMTGEQRVFLGWAQVWRGKEREDALRRQLVADVHSPPKFRVDGVIRNIDGWYAAWGVKPGDPLYVSPDERVRIW
ncbi:MAG: peptidase M13 [Caulobacteraceae bacterium]|nr:peptidase M13 [Caulobacteraceae bacterium]